MGTTLDERPADREMSLNENKQLLLFPDAFWLEYLKIQYLTCTNADYKPSHNDDLIRFGNLTDSHHHSRDDRKDVVEE